MEKQLQDQSKPDIANALYDEMRRHLPSSIRPYIDIDYNIVTVSRYGYYTRIVMEIQERGLHFVSHYRARNYKTTETLVQGGTTDIEWINPSVSPELIARFLTRAHNDLQEAAFEVSRIT